MNYAIRRFSISALNRRAKSQVTLSQGFGALADVNARVLVLGSLPGERSIAAGQYFAHPRNAFWPIVGQLFNIATALPYQERVKALNKSGVALWDVLQASHRKGSLDSAIDINTAKSNDFNTFLEKYPGICLIAFNGRKAAELFHRIVEPRLVVPVPPQILLPSTSPAYAAMPYAKKLEIWRKILL
ncbi:MAG: DNA-deoxyinosine glycosylase [Gammaproteobacteria bacterium]|nr:DNA-deoxyinosine glycosylase [Gammaproteobacteria bacterium]